MQQFQKSSAAEARQQQNLTSLTPQKQYMGKRGERTQHQFESQGKQQLLPALGNTTGQSASSGAGRGKGQSSGLSTGNGGSLLKASSEQAASVKKDKLLITGDDILIEYVARLMIAVKSIKENMLKAQWIY